MPTSTPAPENTARVWIQTSPTRRDLTGPRGILIGSVELKVGQWHADAVPAKAHSPSTRIMLGAYPTEAEARIVVELAPQAPAMVPQPCQQQQGAARRQLSWSAALVDLRADRENTVHYRLKWVLSRGFWLGYQRTRSGAATEVLGMVRTGRGSVAVELLHGGTAVEIECFPPTQQGLRAAKLAVEARVLDQAAA